MYHEEVEVVRNDGLDVVDVGAMKHERHEEIEQVDDVVEELVELAPLELLERVDDAALQQALHHGHLANEYERMSGGHLDANEIGVEHEQLLLLVEQGELLILLLLELGDDRAAANDAATRQVVAVVDLDLAEAVQQVVCFQIKLK